jgi:DNA-binding GntR family transcriptional regulator
LETRVPEDQPTKGPQQLPQWVAERLRLGILEGRLAPGVWLRQEKLAAEHGISAVPVREALKQVAGEGLIEHVPNRGFRVIAFSRKDIEDLYETRAILEGAAARHAAHHLTAAGLAELQALQDQMCASGGALGLARYRQLNHRFHEIIYEASGRPFLCRTLNQLWSTFPTMLWANVPRSANGPSPEREARDNTQHAEILAALAVRDAAAAESAMQRHLHDACRELLATMAESDAREATANQPGESPAEKETTE